MNGIIKITELCYLPTCIHLHNLTLKANCSENCCCWEG